MGKTKIFYKIHKNLEGEYERNRDKQKSKQRRGGAVYKTNDDNVPQTENQEISTSHLTSKQD